jgi:mannosyltransferase
VNLPKQRKVNPWLIPVGLLVLNFILKLLYLGRNDIAMDEPFTVFWAQVEFPVLFEMLKTENNPPLFFLILHFWIKIFGISAFSVRFLPLLFGSITAPLIYLTGRRFITAQSGLIAALIFTFSNYHLAFSHEARVYSLFALLTCLSMYFFLAIIQKPGKIYNLYLFILADVLLLYSHFFGFFVIGIQLISCLVLLRRSDGAKRCLKAGVIVLLFYLPYFPVMWNRFVASSAGTWVLRPALSDLYTMVWRFSNVPVVTVFFLAVLSAAAIKFLASRKKLQGTLLPFQAVILIWFFVPYLAIFLLSFKIPMFLDRYMVFTSIAFYLLTGHAIAYLFESKKFLLYLFAVIGAGGMMLTFNPALDNHRRLREVTETVHSMKGKTTPVVICPGWLDLGFTYHYRQDYFSDPHFLKEHLEHEFIYPMNHPDQVQDWLFTLSDSLILFEEWPEVVDRDNGILKKISGRFKKYTEVKIPESYTVYFFSGRKPAEQK